MLWSWFKFSHIVRCRSKMHVVALVLFHLLIYAEQHFYHMLFLNWSFAFWFYDCRLICFKRDFSSLLYDEILLLNAKN